ncbi:DUF262 domain-containing protein [Nocardia sp. NPDC127579]|uniref:GmrSD restriction endonuclease domain-containing protein n=1 Tax=Nocardia sp. NPDC127579 TaxID=3345402 RepID=UPI0036281A09
MKLDNPFLGTLLEDVGTGRIQLPNFQREWKWDDERIKGLIATVTQNYPLGVVMKLETGGHPQFQPRAIAGVDTDNAGVPDYLLLDGQQRMTSLYQALYRRTRPVDTTDSRGRPQRLWYYIDIANAVADGADREDAIISVPENRQLFDRSVKRLRLDLQTGDAERASGYFPLNLVFDTVGRAEWRKRYLIATDNWDLWHDFEESILKSVDQFLVPTINLPAATVKEAVCSVFERVNTGGVVLTVFELLTATYAGDRDFRAATGADFDLARSWAETSSTLCQEHPVLGSPGGPGLTSNDFLQSIALVHTYASKQAGRSAAVACKRRDLLNLPLTAYVELAPKLQEAFAWVGTFLARQCIFTAEDVPYRSQLVPLAAIRALLLSADAWTEHTEQRIVDWYWSGVLGEMYGGATETRFSRDVEQVLAWVQQPGAAMPDTLTEATFREQRLDTLRTRNSAAYKGIHALLMRQGAVDWFHTEGTIGRETVIGGNVDIRPIFPKSWFAQPGRADVRMNSIVNKTPMSYRAALLTANAPSDSLPVLAATAGSPNAWFDDVVATHLIEPKTLHSDDWAGFYADRSARLLTLIESVLGKRVVRGDDEAGA